MTYHAYIAVPICWSKIPGVYFTGDMATKDKDGHFWLQSRSDDVLNIAGYRIGTAEIESTLVSHKWVAKAACIALLRFKIVTLCYLHN